MSNEKNTENSLTAQERARRKAQAELKIKIAERSNELLEKLKNYKTLITAETQNVLEKLQSTYALTTEEEASEIVAIRNELNPLKISQIVHIEGFLKASNRIQSNATLILHERDRMLGDLKNNEPVVLKSTLDKIKNTSNNKLLAVNAEHFQLISQWSSYQTKHPTPSSTTEIKTIDSIKQQIQRTSQELKNAANLINKSAASSDKIQAEARAKTTQQSKEPATPKFVGGK